MINLNYQCLTYLKQLLKNKSILKLGFGLDFEDLSRFNNEINNVIDIQELVIDNIGGYTNLPSLKDVVKLILNKNINKDKYIHEIGWEKRPLKKEQLIYASGDSDVLLEIYNKFVKINKDIEITNAKLDREDNDDPSVDDLDEMIDKQLEKQSLIALTSKNLIPGGKTKVHKDEFNFKQQVKIVYSGVFLTDDSKDKIKKLYGQDCYDNIHSDHVTLDYKPTEYDIRGLSIGQVVELEVTGYARTDCLTVLRIKLCDTRLNEWLLNNNRSIDRQFHITLSTKPYVKPKEASKVTSFTEVKSFKLWGTVGVFVKTVNDSLLALPEKTRTKIINFVNDGSPNQTLKLKAEELSNSERSIVHEFAKNHKVESVSSGKETKRKLTLTLRRNTIPYTNDESDDENQDTIIQNDANKKRSKYKITNRKNESRKILTIEEYALLNIMTKNTTLTTVGKIINNDVVWFKDIINFESLNDTQLKHIIILRGLSGSGKSYLADYLSTNIHNSVICSTDDYFNKKGKYNFDQLKLDEAHSYCFEKADNCISRNQHVIVDNTNSTKKEYKKYIELADKHNYKLLILEVHTPDKDYCKMFHRRNRHNVGIDVLFKMLVRWEIDDRSQLLLPFEDNEIIDTTNSISLREWICKNRYSHTISQKKKTHFCFGVGNRPLHFLNIPKKSYEEFLEKYYESGIEEGINYEPKFIGEYIDDSYKMIFDIDYIDEKEMSEETYDYMIETLEKVMEFENVKSPIYVTQSITQKTTQLIKSGYHLILPKMIVNKEKAVEFKKVYVKALNESPKNTQLLDWNKFIDEEIYFTNNIRMIGSKKTSQGVIINDLHSLYMLIDEDGNRTRPKMTLDIFKQLSVRFI